MVSTINKVLIIIFAVCLFNSPAMSQGNQKCMILSDGSQFKKIAFEETIIDKTLINYDKYGLRNVAWPSYSVDTDQLFFEALSNGKTGVYRVNITEIEAMPEFLYYGKFPSLSHDGKVVAYIDASNKLVISDISTGGLEVVSDSVTKQSVWKRPIWLSNSTLIYVSKSDNVMTFNRLNRSHDRLFQQNLFPLASNSKLVLFTDQDAKKIYKYQSGVLDVIWSSNFLTIGPSATLTNDGFVYSRQTWKRILSFSENKSVFHHSNKQNQETELFSDLSLFGGAIISCENDL